MLSGENRDDAIKLAVLSGVMEIYSTMKAIL